MKICNREIRRVLIVDDDSESRDSFAFPIEELNLEPIKFTEHIVSTEDFTENAQSLDAVLCDFHLKKHSFSKFNGDALIAACFHANIPGVLCSTFTDIDFTISRASLRFIPSMLKGNSPDPDDIHKGLTRCLEELNGLFQPSRRPWRTQVCVEEVDEDQNCTYVMVPAWDAHRKIRVEWDDIPQEIHEHLYPDKILHAEVNIGAVNHEDLFFVSWEPK